MEYAKIEFVGKVHSEWGASGYYRWSTSRGGCPGSVRHIRENAPPELLIDDEVKDDGIEAHGLAEAWLKEREIPQRAVLKAKANNNGGDLVMLNAVAKYVNYVDELATLPGAELLVETSFDLSWLASDLFGTTDAIIYAPFSDYWDLETETLYKGPILHVVDLKYGFKEVDANDNPQALYYALGAYAHYRSIGKAVNRIVLHIWQPRVIGRKNAAVRWSCDVPYLERFALALKDDRIATDDPDAPLVPKIDHCRLCKGRTTCPELIKPAWTAARLQILNQGGDPVKSLPTFEQGKSDPGTLYMIAGLAKKWAESTIERTRADMQQGAKMEGLKLVGGKNMRAFRDVQAIQEMFPRESWPEFYEEPELKSASAILDALNLISEDEAGLDDLLPARTETDKDKTALQRFEEAFVVKIPCAPLVALESDKRPAWSSAEKAKTEWADDFEKKPGAIPPPPPPPAVVYAPVQVVPVPPNVTYDPAPEVVPFDPASFFNTTE